jgi:hypothetical protein
VESRVSGTEGTYLESDSLFLILSRSFSVSLYHAQSLTGRLPGIYPQRNDRGKSPRRPFGPAVIYRS